MTASGFSSDPFSWITPSTWCHKNWHHRWGSKIHQTSQLSGWSQEEKSQLEYRRILWIPKSHHRTDEKFYRRTSFLAVYNHHLCYLPLNCSFGGEIFLRFSFCHGSNLGVLAFVGLIILLAPLNCDGLWGGLPLGDSFISRLLTFTYLDNLIILINYFIESFSWMQPSVFWQSLLWNRHYFDLSVQDVSLRG